MAENISGPGGDQKFVSAGEFQAGESASGFISGFTFGPTEVVYYKVNNLAVFEGDIVLGTVAELEQTKDAASHDDGRARSCPRHPVGWMCSSPAPTVRCSTSGSTALRGVHH
jgi:hypothetical protein